MANFSRSSVVLEADAEAAPSRVVDSDTPFRILILGDFSGRSNRGLKSELAGRRPTFVDLDNFDEVMKGMQPTLRLPHADLRFHELDDFHPDHLHRNAEVFQKLAEMRYEPPRTLATAAPVPAGLLDSILDMAAETPAPRVEEGGDLAEFINKI